MSAETEPEAGTGTPRVVVTDKRFEEDVFSEGVASEGGEVVFGDFETEAAVVEGCRDATVVVTFKAPLTRGAFEAMDRCRLVFQNSAGFDSVDIVAANDRGIPVSTPKGYAADEVAEHAITLALAAALDVAFADRDLRESPGFGERPPIVPLSGGTFGIVGFGAIGTAVVPKARGLGMDVVASDPYAPQALFEALGVEREPLDALLARADVISLHCPLTAETRGLLSTSEFDQMKESAVLVNTARGGILDEAALVDAIENGAIGGAGIDVFETEPPEDTPALGCERIVCSPHHAGLCERVLDRAKTMAREEVRRALRGEHPRNVVNPEALLYRDETTA